MPGTLNHPGIRPRRRDRRGAIIAGGMATIALAGFLISLAPSRGVDGAASPPAAKAARHPAPGFPAVGEQSGAKPSSEKELAYQAPIDPRTDPAGHVRQARAMEVRQRLQQARQALKANRMDDAINAAARALQLDPDNVDALTQLGVGLAGTGRFREAYAYLMKAIDLDPAHADAYFGMAVVQEGLGNLEGALGGMRSFLHTTRDPDPNRLEIAQARSAIWEWEAKLGRGPWGPTRGIPPGFKEEDLKRDGRGVAVKMQKGPLVDGAHPEYEIKSGDKQKIFPR